jgi:PhnB protein
MQVQPYLMFGGRCQEAVDFYRRALGAEPGILMRFKEAPEQPPPGMLPENWGDKVMHCEIKIGDTVVMASDGHGPSALSDGGQVTMPLGKTFFSPSFGMLVDRFGLSWMVVVPAEIMGKAA